MKEVMQNLCNGKITVRLQNQNEEKEFLKFCTDAIGKEVTESLKRDETCYEIGYDNGKKKKDPIFPIYYGFSKIKGNNWIDRDTEKESYTNTLIISYNTFKEIMENTCNEKIS